MGKKLVEKSLELAQKNNCDVAYSCTSAKASTELLKKVYFLKYFNLKKIKKIVLKILKD